MPKNTYLAAVSFKTRPFGTWWWSHPGTRNRSHFLLLHRDVFFNCSVCVSWTIWAFLSLQVLFTLTFWLLVRQSVKERFSNKRKTVPPLQDVTTGGQLHGTLCTSSLIKAFCLCEWHFCFFYPHPFLFIRGNSWTGVGAEGGGRDGDEPLRQVLDPGVWRDVHHGVVCWETGRIQDCLHADVLDLPLPLSGKSVL